MRRQQERVSQRTCHQTSPNWGNHWLLSRDRTWNLPIKSLLQQIPLCCVITEKERSNKAVTLTQAWQQRNWNEPETLDLVVFKINKWINNNNLFKQNKLIPSLFSQGQNSDLISNWSGWPNSLRRFTWVIPLGSLVLTLCPGSDQEIPQACGFSTVESVDTKNPQRFGWFKCTFIIVPLCYFHIAQESITSPELCAVRDGCRYHPLSKGNLSFLNSQNLLFCSFLTQCCPCCPVPPAGRAGKWLSRESLIMVINALSFTKFHQSSPIHRSQTIVLCIPIFPFCLHKHKYST